MPDPACTNNFCYRNTNKPQEKLTCCYYTQISGEAGPPAPPSLSSCLAVFLLCSPQKAECVGGLGPATSWTSSSMSVHDDCTGPSMALGLPGLGQGLSAKLEL